jgi:hypothetical protein
VRALSIAGPKPTAPDLARLLRAAPQLRQLTLELWSRVGEGFFLTAGEPITDPAFAGLIHARLRHLIIENGPRPDCVAADCAFVLQQRHFPRLRRLAVNKQEYPVSVTE